MFHISVTALFSAAMVWGILSIPQVKAGAEPGSTLPTAAQTSDIGNVSVQHIDADGSGSPTDPVLPSPGTDTSAVAPGGDSVQTVPVTPQQSGGQVVPPPTPTTPTGGSPAPTPSQTPTPNGQTYREYTIAIDAEGFQDEIDRCLWVRMDIGAAAPIVGAHNHCGGSIVLDMNPGDVITLTGFGLDGRYLVMESRDARPGDNAAEATAGMISAVILQTCYWNNTDVRLLGMLRIAE